MGLFLSKPIATQHLKPTKTNTQQAAKVSTQQHSPCKPKAPLPEGQADNLIMLEELAKLRKQIDTLTLRARL